MTEVCTAGARYVPTDLTQGGNGQISRSVITVWRHGGGARPGLYTCNCSTGFEVIFQPCVVDDYGNLVRIEK